MLLQNSTHCNTYYASNLYNANSAATYISSYYIVQPKMKVLESLNNNHLKCQTELFNLAISRLKLFNNWISLLKLKL